MTDQLPEKQRRILDFICKRHSETGVYPSVREIAAHMDFRSTNTVDYHLRRLETAGALERGGRRARTFSGISNPLQGGKRKATVQKTARGIPLLGRVAAGKPIMAQQQFDGLVNFRSYFHCDDQTFALKVQGDSMIDAGIASGDLVIVRPQGKVENGEIGVAMVGDEATVKRIFDEGNHWRLQPENRTMKPMNVKKEQDQFSIAGKVIGVIRKI